MKKLLLTALLFLSTNAHCYEGGLQHTFKPNSEVKELENKVQYEHLLSEYNIKKQYSEGLTICANKYQYYLPTHPSADIDGCYDLLGYLETIGLNGKEVTNVSGGLMAAFDGTLKEAAVDPRAKMGKGVFLADSLCKINYPNSRAMRYDDIRYLYKKGQLSSSANYIFVFEGISDVYFGDKSKLVKGQYTSQLGVDSDPSCQNYSSASSTYKPLKVRTDITGMVLNTGTDCSQQSRILCVQD